jgi:hypothetical protein
LATGTIINESISTGKTTCPFMQALLKLFWLQSLPRHHHSRTRSRSGLLLDEAAHPSVTQQDATSYSVKRITPLFLPDNPIFSRHNINKQETRASTQQQVNIPKFGLIYASRWSYTSYFRTVLKCWSQLGHLNCSKNHRPL